MPRLSLAYWRVFLEAHEDGIELWTNSWSWS